MRSQIPVDIFAGPGATIDATTALNVANDHGMRDLMAKLLPYAVTGPTFVPDIHQQLTLALANFRAGSVEAAEHHLHEAAQCEPQSWQAVHQPGIHTNTRTQAPTPDASANVHTYPPRWATTLATSYVFQARDHATAGRTPYLLGGGNGLARATWRQRLREAAPGSVAVIAISSPRHIDDQRWRTVATHAAATLDKAAPWMAVRRPQPDGVLVFIVTSRPVTAATRRHIATMATAQLHPVPRPETPPAHRAATPPPPAADRRPQPRKTR